MVPVARGIRWPAAGDVIDTYRASRQDGASPTLREPADFLAGVLSHPRFVSEGVLFGTDASGTHHLRWAVIDPDRHVMYTWRKTSSSLVASGRELGASVFTNGPFMNYPHGGLLPSLGRFGSDATLAVVRAGITPGARGRLGANVEVARRQHLQAPFPLGWVLGAHEGIEETTVSRPRIFWFGRGSGMTFADYCVGQGDPVGAEEAVGGLFRGVTGYRTTTVERVMRTGYWALAPLTDGPAAQRDTTRRTVELYQARRRASHPCTGLVIVVAGRAHVRRLNQLLVTIGVRDAVQFDGGDSLLLGHDRSVLLGRSMPRWKRVLQCWGIQFQPRTPADRPKPSEVGAWSS